jgi:hypothetical protein
MAATVGREHIVSNERGTAMLASLVLPIFALCAVATWIAYCGFTNAQHAQRQQLTLRRGVSCRGAVVGVQRPFLFDQCVRVYFEFVPDGHQQPLRCCHVERRELAEVAAALPANGSEVLVSYLPEFPERAVIEALASQPAHWKNATPPRRY